MFIFYKEKRDKLQVDIYLTFIYCNKTFIIHKLKLDEVISIGLAIALWENW